MSVVRGWLTPRRHRPRSINTPLLLRCAHEFV